MPSQRPIPAPPAATAVPAPTQTAIGAPERAVDWSGIDGAVRRWLGRRAPAGTIDDLPQETLLRTHRTLPSDIRSPEAWALRTAHSVLIDHFRASARRPDAATDPDVLAALAPLPAGEATDRPDAGLDQAADAALDAAIVRCMTPALERLPGAQREALELTTAGNLSQAEAAASAGISVPGMKSRVQRGSSTVRESVSSCCQFELDARGRPIAMESRDGVRCTCGCSDERAPERALDT